MTFVLDASMTMAWCFQDERTEESDAILLALATEVAIVPAMWSVEVCNAALRGIRRKRLSVDEAHAFFRALDRFKLRQMDPIKPRALNQLFDSARTHNLSAYDAAYLDLAVQRGLPLATLDAPLRAAASRLGVPLFVGGSGDEGR